MAVAINTIGTLKEDTGSSSGVSNATVTVPSALSNTALMAIWSVNATGANPPGTLSVSGVAGLTQLGSTIKNASGNLALAMFAVLNISSGAKTVTFSWTGTGSAFDLEGYLLVLTGVDQTALGTSFINATTMDATGTNPQLSFTVDNNGLGIVSFATSNAGDITDVTVGGSTVAITGTHGNAHSINWNSGSKAGTGASITFQGTEGTSQENIGFGIDVVPVGGGDVLMPQICFMDFEKDEKSPILQRRLLVSRSPGEPWSPRRYRSTDGL